MATCSPADLLSAASCFQCLPGQSLELVKVVLLCQLAQAQNPSISCSIDSLMEDAACFQCLSIQQLMVLQTQLICEILHSGGGQSGACVFCGSGPPVAESTCSCAIYYDKDPASPTAGSFWFWSVADQTWIQLIGGP